MDDLFESIDIDLGNPKTREDVVRALWTVAEQIECGYYSGIAGWSDVSWSIIKEGN